MAEPMNISFNGGNAENEPTEVVSVDVTDQRVVFQSTPRRKMLQKSENADDMIMSPVHRLSEKRKILTERQTDVVGGDGAEAREAYEPTIKRGRFTREALRAAYSAPSFTAPVLWAADAGSDGSALYLGKKKLVVGTNDGRVLYLDLDGHVTQVQQLPLPASSLIRDGPFLYAWCPAQFSFDAWKGALYDLTPEVPRLLFDVENVGEWMTIATIRQGMLILGDDKGSLANFGTNGEVVWFKEATDGRGTSKMLLADESGIYYGHRKKVIKYDPANGDELWSYEATGRHVAIHHGIQDDEHIFVEMGAKVVKLAKSDGSVVKEYIPLRHRASNVCTGNGYLITGSCPTVLFDLESAEEQFRMNFAGRLNDSIMAMHPSGKLIAVWDKIYCMDLAREAVQRAVEGKSMRTREVTVTQTPVGVAGGEAVVKTTEKGGGVTVEVRQEEDGSTAVYALDGLLESKWGIRFPKSLQIVGKKYVVDGLIPHENYKFYSVQGDIRELVDELHEEAGVGTAAEQIKEKAEEKSNDETAEADTTCQDASSPDATEQGTARHEAAERAEKESMDMSVQETPQEAEEGTHESQD